MNDVQGIENLDALKMKLMRWAEKAPQEVEKVLRIAAEDVRREAQLHHLSGPKMPRGVGDPINATLAVQTGLLRRSIAMRVSVKPGEIMAEVGTSVPYGRRHELGLANERGIKMPERPFLRPSLAHEHSSIFKMIDKAWFETYGK